MTKTHGSTVQESSTLPREGAEDRAERGPLQRTIAGAITNMIRLTKKCTADSIFCVRQAEQTKMQNGLEKGMQSRQEHTKMQS